MPAPGASDIFARWKNFAGGTLMTLRHLARVLLVVTLAAAGACANTPTTKRGLPWWPQGPGNAPSGEQSAAAEQGTQAATASAPAAPAATAPAATAEPRTQASAATALPAATPSGAAQATRYGDLLFLSGQVAADRGGVDQQTHAVMQKIGAILDTNRLTMANIVHVTVYLANIKDVAAMDAAYASHFRGTLPARTVVEVTHLPGDALVQVAAIAGR